MLSISNHMKELSVINPLHIILFMVVCGIYFAEPDIILVFKIFCEVFGGGTRLAMPKTICTPDSSSLKPGSGAIEGVLD